MDKTCICKYGARQARLIPGGERSTYVPLSSLEIKTMDNPILFGTGQQCTAIYESGTARGSSALCPVLDPPGFTRTGKAVMGSGREWNWAGRGRSREAAGRDESSSFGTCGILFSFFAASSLSFHQKSWCRSKVTHGRTGCLWRGINPHKFLLWLHQQKGGRVLEELDIALP